MSILFHLIPTYWVLLAMGTKMEKKLLVVTNILILLQWFWCEVIYLLQLGPHCKPDHHSPHFNELYSAILSLSPIGYCSFKSVNVFNEYLKLPTVTKNLLLLVHNSPFSSFMLIKNTALHLVETLKAGMWCCWVVWMMCHLKGPS